MSYPARAEGLGKYDQTFVWLMIEEKQINNKHNFRTCFYSYCYSYLNVVEKKLRFASYQSFLIRECNCNPMSSLFFSPVLLIPPVYLKFSLGFDLLSPDWCLTLFRRFLLIFFTFIHVTRLHYWHNSYHHRKWAWLSEFKSWTRLFAFHIVLMLLGKVRGSLNVSRVFSYRHFY